MGRGGMWASCVFLLLGVAACDARIPCGALPDAAAPDLAQKCRQRPAPGVAPAVVPGYTSANPGASLGLLPQGSGIGLPTHTAAKAASPQRSAASSILGTSFYGGPSEGAQAHRFSSRCVPGKTNFARAAAPIGLGVAAVTALHTSGAIMANSSAALTLGDAAIRQLDGLFSLNDLHAAAGGAVRHQPTRFIRLDQTQALIAELANSPEVVSLKTAEGRNGGTYACRELVIAYAAWISPAFHLQVIRVFLSAAPAAPAIDAQPATAASRQLHQKRALAAAVAAGARARSGIHAQLAAGATAARVVVEVYEGAGGELHAAGRSLRHGEVVATWAQIVAHIRAGEVPADQVLALAAAATHAAFSSSTAAAQRGGV